jgi:hypothetical protein
MAGEKGTHRDLVKRAAGFVEGGGLNQLAPARMLVEDGGTDLGLVIARAAKAVGRPLRPSERQAVKAEVLARQSGPGEQPAAGQPPARKPRLRDRLEAMSEDDRDAAVASVTPGTKARAYMERLVESIREAEAEADFLVAREEEERVLAEDLDDDEPYEWPDLEETENERLGAMVGRQSDSVNAEYEDDYELEAEAEEEDE